MSICELLKQRTELSCRNRGKSYHEEGAVTELELSPGRVSALVEGGDLYEVEITHDERRATAYSCTCPYYRDWGIPCKHIWAAALAADAHEWGPATGGPQPKKYRPPQWKTWLTDIQGASRRCYARQPRKATQATPVVAEQEVRFAIDEYHTRDSGQMVIEVVHRQRGPKGQWKKFTRFGRDADLSKILSPAARELIALVRGLAPRHDAYGYYSDRLTLPQDVWDTILPRLATHGLLLRQATDSNSGEIDQRPIIWEPGEPWRLVLQMRPANDGYAAAAVLRRGEQAIPITAPRLLISDGLLLVEDRLMPLDPLTVGSWLAGLRKRPEVAITAKQAKEFLVGVMSCPDAPALEIPEELRIAQVRPAPRPHLLIRPAAKGSPYVEKLRATLAMDYDGLKVSYPSELPQTVYDSEHDRVIHRDHAAETAALGRLAQLGLREYLDYERTGDYYEWKENGRWVFLLSRKVMPKAVGELIADGWKIEAEGKLYRPPGRFDIQVNSGIDWFELNAQVEFDGQKVKLPQLLAAIRRGENTIVLDDGTMGMLPEKWLKKYGFIAQMGTAEGDAMRFKSSQAGLLDALLASQPEAKWDEAFERTRQELRQFAGVQPKDPPATFQGQLRPYQRDALGWFEFLQKFGFGGCLADDMGLGKTVQVLAMLQSRSGSAAVPGRTSLNAAEDARAPRRPSLVVVPRSLIFNWLQESARFTPELKVLDHSNGDRIRDGAHLAGFNIVLTTYGTLRRDAGFLKDIEFDYAVLDEAQAIKNPASESAKAARLIRARHRLALSGTPVQNHLGDLWSIFDFLNPGMLGNASVFSSAGLMHDPDEQARALLSKAVRPFILRRTKEQVASDLPPRLEQTVYCELDGEQRKLYNELRDHYRRSLLRQVDDAGIARSKIQILEALLRLRQAALHPGLLDKSRADAESAKLNVLLGQLNDVVDEGHKALVFSQFTSMLAIVRNRLDEQKTVYEYLDGQTKDRQHRVERFQTDPNCKLFLISLKAGGLGLNLTAADYVFLLDPWWNPAVEQQAIDRTHRIGQTRQVYACRLIAKDTVEEKVLALQQSKRDLADAIITADNSILRTIGREELELLLS